MPRFKRSTKVRKPRPVSQLILDLQSNPRQAIIDNSMPIPEAGCWLWVGEKGGASGSLTIEGKGVRAHHISYRAFIGPIPEDHWVGHTCRVYGCVNPNHLYVERYAEEGEEGFARPVGSKHPDAKLTEGQVLQLRSEHATGKVSQAKLAKKYDISENAVHSILSRRSWTHI